jgi:hypothetical protein
MSSVRIKTAMLLIGARPAAQAGGYGAGSAGKKAGFRRLTRPPGREHSNRKLPVSRKSPPVTCGYLVRKAVENDGHMRITSHSLWITMWIAKSPGKDGGQVLRGTELAQ